MSQKPCATLLIAIYFRPKVQHEPEEVFMVCGRSRHDKNSVFPQALQACTTILWTLRQGCPMVSSLVAYAIEGINIRRTKSLATRKPPAQ